MKNLLYISAFTLIVLFSCREQTVVIPEITVIDTERIVLLEELTGVSCPNCPTGAAVAAEILANFPGRVIVVGIHGDLLAEPVSESKYDFRSDQGKDLEQYLEPYYGKPAAAINRVAISALEFATITTGLWPSFVEDELAKPHVLDLTAEVTFDATDRSVDVAIAAIPKIDLEGVYNVTVMLTENHIIDAQEDQGVIIEDYEHEHVLRTILTPFDGANLASAPTAGEILNGSFSTTIPAEDGTWIAENMEVVVFVHRVDAGHKEVLQAFSAHVTE